MKNKVE